MFQLAAIVSFVLILSSSARAQSLEAGGHFVTSQWSEFDGADLGFGGRFTFKPTPLIGVDAELSWYPSEFPSEGAPFSGSRFEGLFGVTVGPRINRIRPFAKFAAGFLQTSGTQERIICLAIFPPPLNCVMAADQTLPAFEFGGGVEVSTTDRSFLRVDVTDRMLEYPGPTLTRDFEVRDEGFYGHALRFTLGAGFRF
jgi:hypothetical protein